MSRPLRALGGKRPIDVDAEEVITLIARLERGLGA
nr:MbcA/ParS/Xre antitoxin family protein [Pseudomonas viridiflava]